MEANAIHDSGERQQFATGAVRDTAADKPRLELISPIFLRRLGHWLRLGADKYAARNWERGMSMDRCMASALRHLNAYREGLRDEDHLAAAGFNVMALIHFEEMVERGLLPAELNDMPTYCNDPADYPGGQDAAYLPVPPDTEYPKVPRCMGVAYIAGPMRNIPQCNFPAFDAARDKLKSLGWQVISPADMDRESGFDGMTDPLPADPALLKKMLRERIACDLHAIQFGHHTPPATHIALLPGWLQSSGATVELTLAKFLDLGVICATTGEPMRNRV